MTVWVLGKFGLQPLRPARRRIDTPSGGEALARARGCSTARPTRPRSTSSRSRSPSCSARPVCRTCSCGSTRCRRPRRPGAVGRVGDLAHRHLLPVHAGARLRRGCPRRSRRRSRRRRARRNSAAPLLAYELGGDAAARHHLGGGVRDDPRGRRRADDHRERRRFAHDIYAHVIKKGRSAPDGEVRVARITAVVIGILAILGGIFANGQNIAFLVALAFAIAASREPADDPLLAVLEAVQHPGRAVEHLRRADHLRSSLIIFCPVVSGKVDPTTGKSLSMIKDTGDRLPLVPARQPGHHLDPAGVPARLARHGHEQGALTRRSTPRWRSAPSPARAPRRRSGTRAWGHQRLPSADVTAPTTTRRGSLRPRRPPETAGPIPRDRPGRRGRRLSRQADRIRPTGSGRQDQADRIRPTGAAPAPRAAARAGRDPRGCAGRAPAGPRARAAWPRGRTRRPRRRPPA